MTSPALESREDLLSPKKILIIRLSAIGDVVFASPLIKTCKARWPDAEIFWLAEGTVKGLLEDHPDLSGLLVAPVSSWKQWLRRGQWISLWRSITGMQSALSRESFDLVLDVQGLLKSSFLAWLTGARRRVGFRSKEPMAWFMTEQIDKDLGPGLSSEYRAMASYLGCDTERFAMDIVVSDSALEFAQMVAQSGAYIALCPFTTRAQKHWPTAHWQSLIDRLLESGYRLMVLGGPTDAEAAQQLIGERGVESLVGRASLAESAAVVARASAVVGVDTGLTHLGFAHRVPTIALFGSTRPYIEIGDLPGSVIYKGLSCSPCRRRPTCGGRFDCLVDITPEEVMISLKPHVAGISGRGVEPVVLASAPLYEEGGR